VLRPGHFPVPLPNALQNPGSGTGKPIIFRDQKPIRKRDPAHWHDTIAVLVGLQAEYAAWLEALPANLQDSAIAEALQAISDLDLGELQAIEPPRGFGRD